MLINATTTAWHKEIWDQEKLEYVITNLQKEYNDKYQKMHLLKK